MEGVEKRGHVEGGKVRARSEGAVHLWIGFPELGMPGHTWVAGKARSLLLENFHAAEQSGCGLPSSGLALEILSCSSERPVL